MTTNDFDRTARLWLEDGPNELSDRVLQAALDEIHVTRQRRTWWPAPALRPLSDTMRVAAVLGMVVLVVAGLGLLFPIGGPSKPVATPPPTPRALTLDEAGVGPGTFVAADPFPVRVTFTLPSGWDSAMGGPYLVDLRRPYHPEGLTFSIFDLVYADPCHPGLGFVDPVPGPRAADLAAVLASRPGLAATAPIDVTVDGYPGKQLTLTAPATFDDCAIAMQGFVPWVLPMAGANDMSPGQRDRVWILDVEDQRLVIATEEMPGQTPQEEADVQGILDSIRLAPAD
jgi:hypothetical protein